jgi:hypothetical protein
MEDAGPLVVSAGLAPNKLDVGAVVLVLGADVVAELVAVLVFPRLPKRLGATVDAEVAVLEGAFDEVPKIEDP